MSLKQLFYMATISVLAYVALLMGGFNLLDLL
jgi:hypothetical protein